MPVQGSGVFSKHDADGNLVFYGDAQTPVLTIDPTTKTVSMPSGTTLTASGTLTGFLDDVIFGLGTDSDIAQVLRSTVLNANTALTGAIVGTPVTPAVAANSLIVANKTADGDVLVVTQSGGNSYAAFWYDASAKIGRLYGGSGVEVIKIESAKATVTGTLVRDGAGFFAPFGTAEAVTIASGVATITKPYVILDAEGAGTTDQLDTITYTAGEVDGALLLLKATATDTITVDDANINLGAATRALAPGGTMLLRWDGTETQWTEVLFLASADNT